MQSDLLEDGRPRPSREPGRNHSVAVPCSRRHGSARSAVRSRKQLSSVFLCVLCGYSSTQRSPRNPSPERDFDRLLRLRPNCQPKHRSLSLTRHIQSAHRFGMGQVERFAVLTSINLGVLSPNLLRVATSLLQHVSCVIPAFKMSATKFALGIVFVAGALPRLLDLDLMVWELLR